MSNNNVTTTTLVLREPKTTLGRKVHFADRIGIKEYAMALGDNPACTSGPPIQLGWEVESYTERNFQFYEYFRSTERLRGRQLKIPAKEREMMLIETLGYTLKECLEAEEQIKRDRQRRLESLKDVEWDRFSILLLRKDTTTSRPSVDGHRRRRHQLRRAVSIEDDVTPSQSMDRRGQFRTFMSFRLPSSPIETVTAATAVTTVKEEDSTPRKVFPKPRQSRSFVLPAGDGTSLLDRDYGIDTDQPIIEETRRRRSFVTTTSRREIPKDTFSPGKVGKGFLKSTGEMMRNFTQLGPPFTKNARMA